MGAIKAAGRFVAQIYALLVACSAAIGFMEASEQKPTVGFDSLKNTLQEHFQASAGDLQAPGRCLYVHPSEKQTVKFKNLKSDNVITASLKMGATVFMIRPETYTLGDIPVVRVLPCSILVPEARLSPDDFNKVSAAAIETLMNDSRVAEARRKTGSDSGFVLFSYPEPR